MLAEELLHSPVVRERSDVGDVYLVVGHAYLDRDVARVVLVDKGVEDKFAQRLTREREFLLAVQTVRVADLRLQVLEVDEVESPLRLLD